MQTSGSEMHFPSRQKQVSGVSLNNRFITNGQKSSFVYCNDEAKSLYLQIVKYKARVALINHGYIIEWTYHSQGLM